MMRSRFGHPTGHRNMCNYADMASRTLARSSAAGAFFAGAGVEEPDFRAGCRCSNGKNIGKPDEINRKRTLKRGGGPGLRRFEA